MNCYEILIIFTYYVQVIKHENKNSHKNEVCE